MPKRKAKQLRQNQKPEHSSFQPVDQNAWREWLRKNHATSQGVWLTVRKKNSPRSGIFLEEALDVAVSYGWIDSKLNVLNQDYYRLLFTPRKHGGTWSQRNKQRVARLSLEGRMTAAGLAKVEDAKRDGSWEKLVSIDALRTPQDLQSALAKDDKARKNYESLSDSAKKQILWWIESAKTSDTRIKRIKGSVEKLQKSNDRPFS